MKIDTLRSGGQSQGGLDASGGTLTGPLMLSRDPQVPLEAATKRYIDNNIQALNAGNIVTGTLPIARLPAFSGDVTSEAGQNTMNLSNTGVTPGEYGKVVVDAKGRVTNGTGVGSTDIPNISFDKITTGKPTTLAGYGITDALSIAGGAMTGELILSGNPVSGENMVPKQYVDGMTNSLSAAKTGDIVRKGYSTTPVGFLKCNGAEVSKTTYADLYSVLGDSNTSFNVIGAGCPWKNQYEFNKSQSIDIGPWSAGTALPGNFGYSKAIVTKNRVYLVAGHNETSYVSTVYTAPINDDGTLGAWSTGTSLPNNISETATFITKNRVYIIGGYTGSAYQNTVYTAVINADGTLGSWILDTNTLPANLRGGVCAVTRTKVYFIGGNNGSGANLNIYVSNLNSDGTIGSWSTAGTLFAGGTANSEIFTTKNYLYVIGGRNDTNIYSAPINSDGTIGTFTLASNSPTVSRLTQVFTTNNRVYTLGGYDGSAAISTVYHAPINADGTLGTWVTGTSIPGTLYGSQVIATKSKIYLLGGVSSVPTWTNVVYVANVSGGLNDYSAYYSNDVTNYMMPGSGQPWKQQYQVNLTHAGDISGWTTAGNLPAVIASSIPFITKNRVYLVGGCTSSTTYGSVVYTAPINSNGTLGTWTTSTAFPINIAGASAIVVKNKVYIIGGSNSVSLNTVYSAPINADGTIGSWTAGTSLPTTIGYNCAFITKNRVYILGNGTVNVYTAPINTDGTLGTWTTSGSPLPVATSATQVAVTKNRVFIVGGFTTGTTGNVYSAPINSNGTIGQWSFDGGPSVSFSHSQCIIVRNYLYLLGGYTNTSNVSTVYYAMIKEDGNLGTWISGTSIPGALNQSSAIITKNHVFLLGGDTNNNAAYTSVIYTATIAEGLNDYSAYYDGTISPIEPVDATTTFKLPDMSATDLNGIYHYIKY